jgi:ketosteroid isomerase-like protein
MTRWAIPLILALAPAAFAAPQSERAKRAGVQTAFGHCIDALRTLDGDRFGDCFTDDVTLFNPDIPDAKSWDEAGYGRRTMVLVRRPAGWKILHIHASNIAPRP